MATPVAPEWENGEPTPHEEDLRISRNSVSPKTEQHPKILSDPLSPKTEEDPQILTDPLFPMDPVLSPKTDQDPQCLSDPLSPKDLVLSSKTDQDPQFLSDPVSPMDLTLSPVTEEQILIKNECSIPLEDFYQSNKTLKDLNISPIETKPIKFEVGAPNSENSVGAPKPDEKLLGPTQAKRAKLSTHNSSKLARSVPVDKENNESNRAVYQFWIKTEMPSPQADMKAKRVVSPRFSDPLSTSGSPISSPLGPPSAPLSTPCSPPSLSPNLAPFLTPCSPPSISPNSAPFPTPCSPPSPQFTCHDCSLAFPQKRSLARHIKWIHLIHYFLRYSCGLCSYKSHKPSNIHRHWVRMHSGPCRVVPLARPQPKTLKPPRVNRFQCSQCSYKNHFNHVVKKHWNKNHTGTPVVLPISQTCPACSMVFDTVPELREHVNRAHPSTLSCKLCTGGTEFMSVSELEAHYTKHHGTEAWTQYQIRQCKLVEKQLKTIEKNENNLFPCFLCGVFCSSSVVILRSHIHSVHLRVKRVFCKICSLSMSSEAEVHSHIRKQHPGALQNSLGYHKHFKQFQTLHSSFKDTSHETMEQMIHFYLQLHHRESHSGVIFPTQSPTECYGPQLTLHQQLVHFYSKHVSSVSCPICQYHVLECCLTDKAEFELQVSAWKVEVCRIDSEHYNVQMFDCYACNHKAGSLQKIRRHIASKHSTVVELSCFACSEVYYHRHAIEAHWYREHGVSQHEWQCSGAETDTRRHYPCRYCPKVCSDQWLLNAHIAHAHPTRVYCDNCSFAAESDYILECHAKLKHQEVAQSEHNLATECQLLVNIDKEPSFAPPTPFSATDNGQPTSTPLVTTGSNQSPIPTPIVAPLMPPPTPLAPMDCEPLLAPPTPSVAVECDQPSFPIPLVTIGNQQPPPTPLKPRPPATATETVYVIELGQIQSALSQLNSAPPNPVTGMYSCYRCTQTFTTKHSARIHVVRDHLKIRRFLCFHCDAAFSLIESVKFHAFVYHPTLEPKFLDKIKLARDKYFQVKPQESLRITPSIKSKFTCKKCSVQLETESTLKIHMKLHIFVCDFCSKILPSKRRVDLHIKSTHISRYECLKCPYKHHSKYSMETHCSRVHGQLICHQLVLLDQGNSTEEERIQKVALKIDRLMANPITLQFMCVYCPLTFPGKQGVKVHAVKDHLNILRFLCAYCSEAFSSVCEVKLHSFTLHPTLTPKFSDKIEMVREQYVKNRVPCNFCKSTKTVATITAHLKTCSGKLPCTVQLYIAERLDRHWVENHQGYQFESRLGAPCRCTYSSAQGLMEHYTQCHSGEARCARCGFHAMRGLISEPGALCVVLWTAENLRQMAARVETTVLLGFPYRCFLCYDCFISPLVFRAHVYTRHLVVERFKCGVCQYGGYVREDVVHHAKYSGHGEQVLDVDPIPRVGGYPSKLRCRRCEQQFYTSQDLQNHEAGSCVDQEGSSRKPPVLITVEDSDVQAERPPRADETKSSVDREGSGDMVQEESFKDPDNKLGSCEDKTGSVVDQDGSEEDPGSPELTIIEYHPDPPELITLDSDDEEENYDNPMQKGSPQIGQEDPTVDRGAEDPVHDSNVGNVQEESVESTVQESQNEPTGDRTTDQDPNNPVSERGVDPPMLEKDPVEYRNAAEEVMDLLSMI